MADASGASKIDRDRGIQVPTPTRSAPSLSRGVHILPRTIRGTLLLLLLVVLIPMLSVQASVSYRWYESRQDREFQSNLELARAAAATFDTYIKDILHQELAIGRSLLLLQPEQDARRSQLLATIALDSPSIRSLSWVSPQGRVIASTSPEAISTDLGRPSYLREILEGKEWTVSDLAQGTPSETPGFVIARGLRGDAGALLGIVVAIIDPERLGKMLPLNRAGEGSVSIIDSQGVPVFRSPEIGQLQAQHTRQHSSEALVAQALAGMEVTGTSRSALDGKERLHGFSPIRSIGWVACASRTVEEALEPVIQELILGALALLFAGLLALLAALLASRNIIHPVSRLREHALALGRGELDRRVETGTLAELEELAGAFNRMAREVWGREVELAGLLERLRESNRQLAIDITERQLVEHALRESEARFRAIFERSAIGMALVGVDGRAIDSNRALQEMLGYSNDEIREKTLADITHPEDIEISRNYRQELFKGKRDHYQVEKRYLRKDSQVMWGRVTASLVRDPKGAPQFGIFMVEDVTGRKQLEEQLLRAQRLETAGRIAGQVAHDFNNLLSPLVAYPELIKMQLPEGHPASVYCDAMMESAERVAAINEDMMALGRRGHFEEEPVDLNELVRQALDQLPQRPSTLEVELQLDPALMMVVGSPAQLLRAISNVVSNAREAVQDTGHITIKTQNIYVEEAMGSYNRVDTGEYALLTVADSGPGIPAEIRDKIFDAFFTTKTGSTKRRGAGLGLSIVQAVVQDHRGYVDLESDVGKGTTFSIYLPISRQSLDESQREEVVGGIESVLVVDDDQSQRRVTTEQLKALGYRVAAVGSGEEAVSYLQHHEVDLLLLDMIMPSGIDGTETYRRISKTRPGQKALIVSGFAETEQVNEAQQLGAGAYLRKPLTLVKLARAVRAELDR